MSILTHLDAWLGKTLFHPPIILACQMTRQTQHAMSRALWFFACCHATYYGQDDGWGWAACLWFWTIVSFISAAAFPDVETRSFGWFRFLIWMFLALEVVTIFAAGQLRAPVTRHVIILFAEYAATLRSIPPRKKRERKVAHKEARA